MPPPASGHRRPSVDTFEDPLHYEKLGAKWFVSYFNFVERFGKFIFAFWIIV